MNFKGILRKRLLFNLNKVYKLILKKIIYNKNLYLVYD